VSEEADRVVKDMLDIIRVELKEAQPIQPSEKKVLFDKVIIKNEEAFDILMNNIGNTNTPIRFDIDQPKSYPCILCCAFVEGSLRIQGTYIYNEEARKLLDA